MAIYHFSAKVISRSAGRSAVAAAAYRSAELLHDERLDRDHDFTAKTGVVHSEIMLPDGAPERWQDRKTLWNEVEARERQKNSQLARDIEISLPRELSRSEAIALAQDFVREQFVSRGMVADLNVHWGIGADGEAQPHAHVMLTMRKVVPEQGLVGHEDEAGFGPKERSWNATPLLVGWRERWAEMANQRLCELGHDARIDHRSYAEQDIKLEPQHKVGPAGARRAERGEDAERRAEHDDIARRNGERILDNPMVALDALTRQHSTFTRQDLARFVSRHTDGAAQFAQVMATVEGSPELVRLGQDGRGRERFSTRDMVAAEQRMEDAAADLGASVSHRIDGLEVHRTVRRAQADGLQLGTEQRDAVHHVTTGRDLALVVGYAGTGKSAMLGMARQAWEGAGYRVRGAALSGIAAEGLEGGSGIESRTLASLEWGWKDGRDELTARDVLVVDEAGMVGSRQMERVLSAAQAAGAKVVLVGDPEQLQAIEAGAAFRALAERHGAAEIGEIRRQREGWQRDATRELATARTVEALGRYERAGMVQAHDTREGAREALVEGWAAARVESPRQSQVILAYTRVDVAALNELARDRLRQAGELGADQVVQTERGERAMAAGDRLMFLRNERGLGAGPGGRGGVAVKNGTLGTVLAVEAGGERLTVQLDGPAGGAAGAGSSGTGPAGKDAAPMVTFYTRDYGHVDHGYAATIHKAQGVTVDRVHVLASEHMDRHAAYVALTRHRGGVALHYGRDEFADERQLARTLARERAKDTTLDYGNRVRPDQGPTQGPGPGAGPAYDPVAAYAERRGLDPLRPKSEIVVQRSQTQPEVETSAPKPIPRTPQNQAPQAEPEEMAPVVPAPLLPAHSAYLGRDSLGRGTTPTEIAMAVERDTGVRQRERDLGVWMRQAYRDPGAARAQLDALERAEGGPHEVARALRASSGGPELLGELRGKTGWFASKAAKAERDAAVRCAESIGTGLVRLRETEAHARKHYLAVVEAQRVQDRVEVPGLSPAAWAAVRAVEQAGEAADRAVAAKPNKAEWEVTLARQAPGVAAAWKQAVVGRPGVEAELRAVAEAAKQRLGEDGLRDLVRSARSARIVQDGSVQRQGLAGIGQVVAALGEGQKAHAAQQQRMREAQRLKSVQQEGARDVPRRHLGERQGRGPRMGM